LILSQHEGQKLEFEKKKIKSVVNPNLIDMTLIPNVINPVREEFIYVGSIKKRKGIAEFYELVTRSPNLKFKVIGQPSDKTGFLYLDMLKSCSNVKLLGRLSHSDTILEIANSKAIISTSKVEGFPNIFIESWAYGISVFSLYVNPGNIIEREKLGYFANGNIDNLTEKLNSFDTPAEVDLNAKRYVIVTHALNEKKIADIDTIFKGLIQIVKSN